jgi:hypothetical protein
MLSPLLPFKYKYSLGVVDARGKAFDLYFERSAVQTSAETPSVVTEDFLWTYSALLRKFWDST